MNATDLMRTIARLEADRGTMTFQEEATRMGAIQSKRAEYRAANGDMDALDREIDHQQRITDQAIADGEYYSEEA